jgi:hypothetical protein
MGNLTRHVRVVHEKRRDHVCLHCTASFGTAAGLTTHVRTQHPDNTQHNERPKCFESFAGVAAAASSANTRCSHRFCRACIEEWLLLLIDGSGEPRPDDFVTLLQISDKCPVCWAGSWQE